MHTCLDVFTWWRHPCRVPPYTHAPRSPTRPRNYSASSQSYVEAQTATQRVRPYIHDIYMYI